MDNTIQLDQALAKKLLDKLIDHFGVTTSQKDGGYILPDGELLNLNRSNLSAKQYHRAVTELLPESMRGVCDEITIVNLMVVTGIIRYEATGRVHVAMNPTAAQRSRLFSIMKYRDHDYLVLVSDKTAATIGERRFKSPSAHELLEFFEQCYHGKKQYWVDEFALSREGDDYILTFRPSQRAIARYDASTKQFIAQPNFETILELFEQQMIQSQL